MKTKFFGLCLLVMALLVPMISAAITVETPLENTNHTGTMDIYVKYVNASADMTDALAVNTTCYYNVSGWATVGTLSSFTANATGFTATIDVDALTDYAAVEFNCTVGNATDTLASDTITGLTFDSTDPVVTLFVDLDGESQSYGRGLEYSCTTADAIDSGPTETFAVAHPSGDTTSSTNLALQSVHLLFVDTDYSGDYVFTCTSTDYTGNSDSDAATVTVDDLGRLKIVDGDSSSSNTWIWVVLGVVLIWAVNNARKK